MKVYIPKLEHGTEGYAYRRVVPDPDSMPGDFLTVWSFREPKQRNWQEGVRVNWANPEAPIGDFACDAYGVLIAQPRVREIIRRSAPAAEILPVYTNLGEQLDLWNVPPTDGAFDPERAERLPDPSAPRTLYRRFAFHGSRIPSEIFKVNEAAPQLFVSDTPTAAGGLVEHVRAGAVTGLSLLEVWNDEGRDLPEFDPVLFKYAAPLRVPRFSDETNFWTTGEPPPS